MNKGIPPDLDRHNDMDVTHTYERDPTYYYSDGNVVFLVEKTLFKLHASLILPVDCILPTTGNDSQRYPLGVDHLPDRLTDSSDASPIVLAQVTKEQFHNYLLARLGCIYDPDFCALFSDAKSKEKHAPDLLLCFLGIAEVSHQFGMNRLKEWAISQLELVLESMYELAESRWDKPTLLRLHSCARSSGNLKLSSLVANFIQYFISIWTVPDNRPTGQEHADFNLNTCVQLFKDPNLPNDDPSLFGCAFVSILSLGHRSLAWTSTVTRGQRAALNFAQVRLIALPEELEHIKWIVDIYPWQLIVWTCKLCFEEFMVLWQEVFRKCLAPDLRSNLPLKGVVALARLPQYRRLFFDKWDPEFAPHGATPVPLHYSVSIFMPSEAKMEMNSTPSILPPNLPGDTRPRARIRCTESEWPFGYLDHHIQLVYQELAKRYHDIVSYVDTFDCATSGSSHIHNTERFMADLERVFRVTKD